MQLARVEWNGGAPAIASLLSPSSLQARVECLVPHWSESALPPRDTVISGYGAATTQWELHKCGWSALGPCRSATSRCVARLWGRTRDARSAGIAQAASATPASATATAVNVAGSRTGTPKIRLDTVRPSVRPATTPVPPPP